jgi:hypothetical protein
MGVTSGTQWMAGEQSAEDKEQVPRGTFGALITSKAEGDCSSTRQKNRGPAAA